MTDLLMNATALEVLVKERKKHPRMADSRCTTRMERKWTKISNLWKKEFKEAKEEFLLAK